MRIGGLICAGAIAALFAGCERNDIQVYKVSKDTPAADQNAMTMPPMGAAARPGLTWKTPTGWDEEKASDMRVASFKIRGDGAASADVSVIPLGGMAGGDLSNVNRWRGQVGLPAITDEEMSKLAEKVSAGGMDAELFDLAGVNSGSGDKERILGTILHRGDTAWFFKMTGDDQLVAAQKPNFIEFLKSVSFEPSAGSLPPDHPAVGGGMGELPADHPPIGSGMSGMGAMPGMEMAKTTEGLPQWTVPGSWKKEPPTQMLLAKFSAAQDGGSADITVSSFPGDVGGLVANVNRWRRQVGLDALDPGAVEAAVQEISVQSEKGKILDVDGTDSRTGKPVRLIGVILPHGDGTWFFKMTGDAKTVAGQKDAFTKFVQSVKF